MRQLTLRGLDPEVERRVQDLAREEGISLNRAALRLLSAGAGVGRTKRRAPVIGDSLDHLFGTWSEAEARAFDEAVADFETLDEELWA